MSSTSLAETPPEAFLTYLLGSSPPPRHGLFPDRSEPYLPGSALAETRAMAGAAAVNSEDSLSCQTSSSCVLLLLLLQGVLIKRRRINRSVPPQLVPTKSLHWMTLTSDCRTGLCVTFPPYFCLQSNGSMQIGNSKRSSHVYLGCPNAVVTLGLAFQGDLLTAFYRDGLWRGGALRLSGERNGIDNRPAGRGAFSTTAQHLHHLRHGMNAARDERTWRCQSRTHEAKTAQTNTIGLGLRLFPTTLEDVGDLSASVEALMNCAAQLLNGASLLEAQRHLKWRLLCNVKIA